MRQVAIGIQNFEDLRIKNCFYVDKTNFIKEWWESNDAVTLIARPRRFGKTLNMSMLEQFFSVKYANRGELFEGLSIWEEEQYRAIQGTYPVISLSFANVKETNYTNTRTRINQLLIDLYNKNDFLLKSDLLNDSEKNYFRSVKEEMDEVVASMTVHRLCDFLSRYYGKKVIVLLDEYDTPMQEAYVNGYWNEIVAFTRNMFNSTFKTNPYLERAVLTGITRVSKESIISDLNNLKVVTITSDEYAASFGFTEEEVFAALEECGLGEEKAGVKEWYDGFVFGEHKDIYNPWSILNFLNKGKYGTYWANTSSNSLVGKLIQEGNRDIKETFERLLQGEHIFCEIDEQIVYNQLSGNEAAIWSLLLASGYIKALSYEKIEEMEEETYPKYELTLTNREVRRMFMIIVRGWFHPAESDYNGFIKAFLAGDLETMNAYMTRVTLRTFSYFDTGDGPLGDEPERFYHGFVLGLLAELGSKYIITSNRESGFGRYDVMLEPKKPEEFPERPAIILEFKVRNPKKESSLEETVAVALQQIEEKQYEQVLLAHGFSKERIKKYGFAFEGKQVLIGE